MEGYLPRKAQQMGMGNLEQEQEAQQLKQNLLQSLDKQLEEKERKIKEGINSFPFPTWKSRAASLEHLMDADLSIR